MPRSAGSAGGENQRRTPTRTQLAVQPIQLTPEDLAGWLHQDLAGVCEQVVFTVAGLPQVLKGPPLP